MLSFPQTGPPGDAAEGREYFKRRFIRLSTKTNRIKEREIYTQYVALLCFITGSATQPILSLAIQMRPIPPY